MIIGWTGLHDVVMKKKKNKGFIRMEVSNL